MEEPKEMQNEAVEETQNPMNTQETIPETAETNLVEESTVDQHAEEPTAQPVAAAETAQEGEKQDSTEATGEQVAEEEPTVDYSGRSREELVESLKELLREEDITRIKGRVAAIKNVFTVADKKAKEEAYKSFLDNGGVKEEYEGGDDAVSAAYREAYNTYRTRRQKHLDEIEAKKQHNLEQKKAILEELKELINRDNSTLKESYDAFNTIREKWKTIGEVPRSENNGLWQSYHFLVEQFLNRINMDKELIRLDQKKNLESKTLLCEKAEELIVESSITKAFKELQNLREQWKEIGPVPSEQNDEIWNRFCNAANQIDERRKEYYDQRREEQEKNLLAKQALIEKVNELTAEWPTSIKTWTEKSTEIDNLLVLWKTIGTVPKEQNEEIWAQFKGKIDQFYSEKKNYLNSVKDEQTENYNKKIDLCLQAEAIAKREDWKKATEELLELQKQWKQIGRVNKKVSEKIWQRFRSACDEFFERKSEYFNTLRGSEKENLEKKEAIIAELKSATFGEDKEENLAMIKDFQRRWMEVGYVPIAEKERLQNEFRTTINGLFEQLKITAREAETNAFRERIRTVVGDSKAIHGEREKIQEQIQQLHNEINLLENNMGFFSNSKQADLLKEEFEHKAQKAKQEIALLHAKLRILDEAKKQEDAPKE